MSQRSSQIVQVCCDGKPIPYEILRSYTKNGEVRLVASPLRSSTSSVSSASKEVYRETVFFKSFGRGEDEATHTKPGRALRHEQRALGCAKRQRWPGFDWAWRGVVRRVSLGYEGADPPTTKNALWLPVCAGVPLEEWLAGDCPPDQLFDVLLGVVLVVCSLHRRRVIHGDLATRNIMVDPSRRGAQVQLVDLEKLKAARVYTGPQRALARGASARIRRRADAPMVWRRPTYTPAWAAAWRKAAGRERRNLAQVIRELLHKALLHKALNNKVAPPPLVAVARADYLLLKEAMTHICQQHTYKMDRPVREVTNLLIEMLNTNKADSALKLGRALRGLALVEQIPLKSIQQHKLTRWIPHVPVRTNHHGARLYADIEPIARDIVAATLRDQKDPHQREALGLLYPAVVVGGVAILTTRNHTVPADSMHYVLVLVALVILSYILLAIATWQSEDVLEQISDRYLPGGGGLDHDVHALLAHETAHHPVASLIYAVSSTTAICGPLFYYNSELPWTYLLLCGVGRWFYYWLLCKPVMAFRLVDEILRTTYEPSTRPRLRASPVCQTLFQELGSPGSMSFNLTAAAVLLAEVPCVLLSLALVPDSTVSAPFKYVYIILLIAQALIPSTMLFTFYVYTRKRWAFEKLILHSDPPNHPKTPDGLRYRNLLYLLSIPLLCSLPPIVQLINKAIAKESPAAHTQAERTSRQTGPASNKAKLQPEGQPEQWRSRGEKPTGRRGARAKTKPPPQSLGKAP